MKRKIQKIRCGGFTLIELLTTLAVIGVLLGLLIPALNQVAKTATKIKQKAQFYAIGTALEAFRNDYGDYPPSEWDTLPPAVDGDISYGNYSASQRLAEALVGRDGLGFHSSSQFWEDGMVDMDADGNLDDVIYGDPSTYFQTLNDNLASRKGPYLELESANAVRLGSLYNNAIPGGKIVDSYVLVDMYKIAKNIDTQKTVGSPILYYKANKLKIGHGAPAFPKDCTYNINDSLGALFDGLASLTPLVGGVHPLKTDWQIFYDAIQNPNFTSPLRPYRAESFILHSAGPDGLYGTMDDMFNFETEK